MIRIPDRSLSRFSYALLVTCCLAAIAGTVPSHAPAATPSRVLVVAPSDAYGRAATLKTTLESLGEQVDLVAGLPSALDDYRSIWWEYPYDPMPADTVASLASYVQSGRGLFLTGERPCCEGLNASDQALLRLVLKDQDVQVGGLGDIGGPYTFNPDVTDYIAQVPNTLTDFRPNAPGGMAGLGGVSSRNVLAASASVPVGAAWSEQDMLNGRGRIALLMDVNWLEDSDSVWVSKIVENLAAFLRNGLTGTPPDKLGYAFDNEPMGSGFAADAGLSVDDVLTDGVLGSAFTDLHALAGAGFSLRNHAEDLWATMRGGTCFGMALTGGRFDVRLDALHDAGNGREDDAWSVSDEYGLPAPDSGSSQGRPTYTKELLRTLAGAFTTQKSFEFQGSIDGQRKAYAASSDPAGALHTHLAAIMRDGTDGGYSDLSSPSSTKRALIALQTPRHGHAVIAYALRDRQDGGYAIDVWDNNRQGESHTIDVSADGSWSYDPLNWGGSPKTKGNKAAFVTAYPLFAPRGLHYLSNGSGARNRTIADIPSDTQAEGATGQNSETAEISPVLTDLGDYAGATVLFDAQQARLTIVGDRPSAGFRGSRIQGHVRRSAGTGSLRAEFDAGNGTVGATDGPAILAITRDGVRYESTGASRLTVSASGQVTTVADGSGPVVVNGVVVIDADDAIPGSTTETPATKLPTAGTLPSTQSSAARPRASIKRGSARRGSKLRIAFANVANRRSVNVSWSVAASTSKRRRQAARRARTTVRVVGEKAFVTVPTVRGLYTVTVRLRGVKLTARTVRVT